MHPWVMSLLARPYRCWSPEEIAEFNIAEVCESVRWENSKSLHKPNIKKHQKARMKRDKNDVWFLFSHFIDSWYPRLPDKWRFVTLETRKKTVAGWDLFGLGRYFEHLPGGAEGPRYFWLEYVGIETAPVQRWPIQKHYFWSLYFIMSWH